ncbi:hypothetical protein [Halocatena pleomorpha]|uniref:Uncharacterized protein n=1 Tax=Halocatena pleomorpha TaxID=1785090 RepID=A0A3P3RDW0_9EURY|nr:hypothetical protein [Halocatena pleomorpha]RRJ31692.1 hypothetical protein EIK79_06435 [Halocatena pleomorpha]
MTDIRSSPAFTIHRIDDAAFDATCEQFERHNDHIISVIDYSSAVLAREHEIDHAFTFDGRSAE